MRRFSKGSSPSSTQYDRLISNSKSIQVYQDLEHSVFRREFQSSCQQSDPDLLAKVLSIFEWEPCYHRLA